MRKISTIITIPLIILLTTGWGEESDPIAKERNERLAKEVFEHHERVTKINKNAIARYEEILAQYNRGGDVENARKIHHKIQNLKSAMPPQTLEKPVEPVQPVAPMGNDLFIEQFDYRGKKYALLKITGNFEEASIECKKLGGHLLSIDDEEEYLFFKKYLASKKATVWLDLTDNAEEGTWLNYRQKPAKFLRWHLNEPNGKKKQNHVMWPFHGNWDMRDKEGSDKLQILCEWPDGP